MPHGAAPPRRRPHQHPGRHARSMTATDDRGRAGTSRGTRGDGVADAVADARRRSDSRRAADVHQRRQEGRHPRRPRRARRRRRAGAAGRDGWARPIVKALLGKAVVPDDSPYTTGGIGLLGTAPSQEAMRECDTLLMRRHQLPLHRVPPRAGPGEVACRSTSTRPASACATPSRSAWSATAGRILAGAAAAARAARTTARFLETAQERMKELERADRRARHPHRTCR